MMLAAILIGSALAYLRCLGNGFVYDDRELIRDNAHIGEWSFLWKSLVNGAYWFSDSSPNEVATRYRPLGDIWFALNYHLFGLNPIGWHIGSVIVHLIAVWLVFRLALRLTGDRRTSMLAMVIFAVIPVHVQTVAWLSAIGLLLAATLEMGALCLSADRTPLRLGFALALYALALLSHESAAAFPGLVALYAFFIESAGDASGSPRDTVGTRIGLSLIRAAPFIAVMLLYLFARRLVLGAFINPSGGIAVSDARILMTIPRVILTDLVVMMAPSTAGLAHPQLIVTGQDSVDFVARAASPDLWVPVAALATLAAGFAALVVRARRRRLYLFCAGWLLIAISPMMKIGSIITNLKVQDDYLYLASAAACVMLADLAVRLADASAPVGRKIVWGGMTTLIAVYALTLWPLESVWHDNPALFTRCVASFPEAYVCHGALGLALKLAGDPVGAERELKQALRLEPFNAWGMPRNPALPQALAETYGIEGKYAEAGRALAESIAETESPKAGDYALLAEFYDLSGQSAQSEEALKRAESLPKGAARASLARAQIKTWHHDAAGAEAILRGLAKRDHDNYQVWSLLGAVLADQKRYDEALSAYNQAARISRDDPDPHFFMAMVLHTMGREDQALAQCRAALAIEPNDGNARALMSALQAGSRKQ